MNKLSALVLGLFAVLAVLHAEDSEVRELAAFDRLVVSKGIEVLLTKSEENKAVVVSEHIDLVNITTEVSGSVLKISLNKVVFTDVMVQVRLNFKDLQKITARNGAAIRALKPTDLKDIEVDANTGSLIELHLNSEWLRLNASEGSVIKIEGRADHIIAQSNSGSSTYTDKVTCADVEIKANTGGNAYVNASEKLIAKASTKGMLTIYGKPTIIEKSSSLGGTILFKDLPQENE